MFRPKLLFTSLAALALGACSPQDPQAVTSAAIAKQVILPTYSRWVEADRQLAVSALAYCQGKETLETARADFLHAQKAWAELQPLLIGPLAEGNRSWQVQFWPDKKNLVGRQVEQLVNYPLEQVLQEIEGIKHVYSISRPGMAVATAELGRGNMLQAKANIAIAEETIKSTEVARATLQAKVKSAEAALGLARIDMDNTVVTAPAAGQVSEASVRQGQYVTAGSQLLFLVPDTRWVVANFKETQTAGIHVGQLARFTVDGLDGAEFQGHVERIAPATGSEFSVLRADNASGNFTKVVQRLPVRIAIEADQPDMERLRPGMSVIAKVDTSDKSDPQNQEHE